jgi:hypothetical protein
MAEYSKLGTIQNNGYSLVRQDRVDIKPSISVVSWRANHASSGKNRRFYYNKSECWWMPLDMAKTMMSKAEKEGLFSDFDNSNATIVDTNIYSSLSEIATVTLEESFDDEWRDSTAIICMQKCGNWRKVMLINKTLDKVTFRSITKAPDYLFCSSMHTSDGWRLDRSMLDAHPTAFIEWLKYLK